MLPINKHNPYQSVETLNINKNLSLLIHDLQETEHITENRPVQPLKTDDLKPFPD
jgi:hypothetical protein